MSGDSVTFRLDGELTIEKLTDAFNRFGKVLDELDEAGGARVRWVLAGLDFGSAGLTARVEPLDESAAGAVPDVVERYLDAAREVSKPDFNRSSPLLQAMSELVEIADEEHRIILETADDEVIFTAPIRRPVLSIPPPTTKSLGTVRGRVETLSHRKGFRFTLYELVTDRRVSCYLEPDHEDQMRHAWGHIADITGVVTRDTDSGRPLAVRRVTDVEVISEGDTLGFLRARGAVGGSEPAEQVLRRIRDAS